MNIKQTQNSYNITIPAATKQFLYEWIKNRTWLQICFQFIWLNIVQNNTAIVKLLHFGLQGEDINNKGNQNNMWLTRVNKPEISYI